MAVEQTDRLVIWGEEVELCGFRPADLDELFVWFAGSIELARATAMPSIRIHLLRSSQPSVVASLRSIARHRGGISGVKYFLDGSRFDQTPQHRDVEVVLESPTLCCYLVDGALLTTSREAALVVAPEVPRMLLADLIENWLLWRAREAGAVMAHGSGWLREGRVEMLVGPSGVGKTSELFRQMEDGAEFFSNDRIALRLHDGALVARNFPQPVNVGCGTIRELELDLPTFELDDYCKVRLMPGEVLERWTPAYEHWHPVEAIYAPSLEELEENIYWDGDPDHPFWNAALRPRVLTEKPQLLQAVERILAVGERGTPIRITG